jgi:hypothetical protein
MVVDHNLKEARLNSYLLFSIIVLATLTLNYLLNHWIITESHIINFLQEQMGYERIVRLLEIRSNLEWVTYASLPVVYLLKFLLISLWIVSGAVLCGYQVSFASVFRVVLFSEIVWLVPLTILIVWFGFVNPHYTLAEVQYFAPLSLLSLMDSSTIDAWLIQPLKAINLFEVAYIFILAYNFSRIMGKRFPTSLLFISIVYGSALLVWIIVISFISINLS